MNFSDFFGFPDPIVQEMAHKLSDYRDQFQAGQLSQDEYFDLVDDATTLDDIAKAGKTVAELEILDKAIAALKAIAGAASGG